MHPALKTTPPTPPANSIYRLGDTLFVSGATGVPLRIVSGSVRLDRADGHVATFAGLALKGDVVGAESLLFGRYTFTARALSDCTVEPWLLPGAEPGESSLLQTLAASERRAADVVALRCGQAIDRVKRLLLLLARDGHTNPHSQRVSVPELRDIAEITNLAVETVSRSLSRLSNAGAVQKHGWRSAFLAQELLLEAHREG